MLNLKILILFSLSLSLSLLGGCESVIGLVGYDLGGSEGCNLGFGSGV